jgi:hypothetical protein
MEQTEKIARLGAPVRMANFSFAIRDFPQRCYTCSGVMRLHRKRYFAFNFSAAELMQ